MKSLLKDLVFFASLIVLLILVRIYVVSPVNVQGESMMPTLVDGEKALAFKLGDVKRFDIIPLVAPDNPAVNYVKRVIGMPGDTVEYKDDQLYINGEAVAESYLNQYKKEWQDAGNTEPLTEDFTLEEVTGQTTVPDNTYFVLGDNRQVSKDSRFKEVGFIPKENIIGKAKFSIWPVAKWGMIK